MVQVPTLFDLKRRQNAGLYNLLKKEARRVSLSSKPKPPVPIKTIRILYGLIDTPNAKVFETSIQGGTLISSTQVGPNIQASTLNRPASAYAVDDKMGWSVSLSKDGNLAAISSPMAYDTEAPGYLGGDPPTISGNVKVYEYNGTSWSQKGSTLYAGETQDEALVGWSVDLSDDGLKLLVQSPGPADNDGNISGRPTYYVFESGDWVEKSRPNRSFSAGVRGQMSNDGNVIVITNPNSGYSPSPTASVWEYNLSSDTWSNREDITLGFIGGVGLDINSDGSRICAGTYRDVKVYEWDGSSYNQMGSQIDGDDNNELSIFCRMNDAGDIVIVGAPENDDKDTNAGVIRVYRWNGSSWIKDNTELYAPTPSNNGRFGAGLEINPTGDIVAGASNGQISIFQYYNGDWATIGSLAADTGPVTNSYSPGYITLYGQFTIGLSEI